MALTHAKAPRCDAGCPVTSRNNDAHIPGRARAGVQSKASAPGPRIAFRFAACVRGCGAAPTLQTDGGAHNHRGSCRCEVLSCFARATTREARADAGARQGRADKCPRAGFFEKAGMRRSLMALTDEDAPLRHQH